MSYEGGGEGSISDIEIEMILSEGWMDGRTCKLSVEFVLKCVSRGIPTVVSSL